MKSFRRLLKPLVLTTVIGGTGYYFYNNFKTGQIEQQLKANQVEIDKQLENLSTNISELLQHEQKQQHPTIHEQEDRQIEKEESFLNLGQKDEKNNIKDEKQTKQQHASPVMQKQTPIVEQAKIQKTQKDNEAVPIQQVNKVQQVVQENTQDKKIEQQPVTKDNQAQEQVIKAVDKVETSDLKPSEKQDVKGQTEEVKQQVQKTQNKEAKQQKIQAQQSKQKLPQQQSKQQLLQQVSQQATNVPQQKKEVIKQSKPQPKYKIDLNKLHKLSQIPHIPLTSPQKLKNAIVVADMGYTQQFEQKLLETIRNLKHIPKNQQIQIYRVNLADQNTQQLLSKSYGHKIKDQTIFLIKNQLDQNFVDINFDMYMQYPSLINTYLTKLNLYSNANQNDYLKKLQKLSPNQSLLMFIYDDSQPEEKRLKSLLAAKYIEMQLALHHLDHAIKVLPVQAKLAAQSKVIPSDKIRSKSLHIIRKHNEFTHVQPNLHLKLPSGQLKPYHLLADIGFHNKRGEIAIQSYLNKIQTFNTLSITTPYILSVTIDKNRISTDNYKKLMETFRQIKRNNPFPEVGLALKFAEVGYLGKDEPENNQFCIKLANIAQLENQSLMHQIQTADEVRNLGMTQKNWLMNSNQYLYPHQAVSEDLIKDFVQKALSGSIPQYYRSDKPSSIQNLHKIVGSNFNQQILNNSLDHFVFEYSEHCPSCKMISPLIAYINEILQPIPVQQRFDIHVMNCQKNRVKGQVYSPYTPNMLYFKNEWKHAGPVRIGLESIKYQGLIGLYDFCVITKMLKNIDTKKFNEAIQNAKGWDRKEFLI